MKLNNFQKLIVLTIGGLICINLSWEDFAIYSFATIAWFLMNICYPEKKVVP